MYSYIIQLSKSPIDSDDYLTESDLYDDSTLLSHSDYFCDDLTDDQKREWLECFKKTFADVADIDIDKMTMKFKPLEVLEAEHTKWREKIADAISDLKCGPSSFHYNAVSLIEEYNCDPCLVHLDGICRTSGEFFGDATAGYYTELYIGNILDYHI